MANEVEPSTMGSSVLEEIRQLFNNEEIAKAFEGEDINCEESLGELLQMENDAEIFKKLGLNFGKVVKVKTHFKSLLERKRSTKKKVSVVKSKPSMASLASHDPEMRALYLKNRKRVGQLAVKQWGEEFPKFNSPAARNELVEFAEQIAPECSVPQVGFDVNGIIEHIRDFYNEQRRHQKRSFQESDSSGSSPDTKVTNRPTLPSMKKRALKKAESPKMANRPHNHDFSDEDLVNCSQNVKTANSNDSSDEDFVNCSQNVFKENSDTEDSGDTEILSENEHNGKVNVPEHLGQRVVKLIIKLVCGSVISDRETLVNVLKSKFSVSKQNTKSLNHTELLEILAKKFLRNGYVEVEVKNGDVVFDNLLKSDFIIKKEIQL